MSIPELKERIAELEKEILGPLRDDRSIEGVHRLNFAQQTLKQNKRMLRALELLQSGSVKKI